ncbi:sigma-54 interaction domain-containing protein [Desulfonatronum thioautotrophicum]|uniref:sigma-54 interaction domain-containing protein n=1 Tax=Desulfonatronum thioautotrophicum TaxID=617001 RepID=UPI0005EBBDD7|nr:sigma-54-dependent Fis family transcriptional regulator [Desulfonatronum thioautotrophicum]
MSTNSLNPQVHGLFNSPVAFQHLFDEIPHGAFLVDRERRIVAVNSAFEALTGFSREQVRGLFCAHVVRNTICQQHCPVLPNSGDGMGDCPAGNIISCDRKKIPVRTILAPIYDLDGDCQGYLETIEDLRASEKWDWERIHSERYGHLIGNSPEMQRIFQIMPMIGQTDSSVLITGETGTGKDVIAEAVHHASDRAKGPFIKVNCGALPETLLESELFGHQKGAFTGAVESKPGRFRLAHNGTLFLTEIGDLPVNLQTKLLSFLDDKVVYPLGGSKGVKVNVRVIAATLRNLEQMVQLGVFRSDLLFRLNVVRLHLPPLREREGDIRLLLDQFLRTISVQFKKNIKGYSEDALRELLSFPYPGNVRELRNIVEYAVNVCQGDQILTTHLPLYVLESKTPPPAQEAQHQEPRPTLPQDAHPMANPLEVTWKDMEKKMILEALAQARGKRSRAAEILGWARSTLWRKMKEFELGG